MMSTSRWVRIGREMGRAALYAATGSLIADAGSLTSMAGWEHAALAGATAAVRLAHHLLEPPDEI